MLAVIIPTVWLAIATFFVILCRMAARGDVSDAAHVNAGHVQTPLPRAIVLLPAPSRLRHRELTTPCGPRSGRRSYAPQRASHSGRQRP